jgi:hypothetical protein
VVAYIKLAGASVRRRLGVASSGQDSGAEGGEVRGKRIERAKDGTEDGVFRERGLKMIESPRKQHVSNISYHGGRTNDSLASRRLLRRVRVDIIVKFKGFKLEYSNRIRNKRSPALTCLCWPC